jgi:hypothetical protein
MTFAPFFLFVIVVVAAAAAALAPIKLRIEPTHLCQVIATVKTLVLNFLETWSLKLSRIF